jgi:putative transposase
VVPADLFPSRHTKLKLVESVLGEEKKRYTDEQIIRFLKQAEAGVPVKDSCRTHGFSDAAFHKWRSRFGGMETGDAKRLRKLEAKNNKLKKLLAEAHLDM